MQLCMKARFQNTTRLLTTSSPTVSTSLPKLQPLQRLQGPARNMSTTRAVLAPPRSGGGAKGKQGKAGAKRRKKAKGEQQRDSKIEALLQGLKISAEMPRPLIMSRVRFLRHWTIHRAWMLFRRKQREERERTLMQQHQSMHNACEELRKTAGPGLRDTGYLYRVALEKKGVWGTHGIPIEYARPQTETPAREAWNYGWTP